MGGRKTALIAAGVLGIAVVGYFAASAILSYSLGMSCSRDVIDQKMSPDGRKKAAIIDIGCGATTPLQTRVLIADVATRFDDERDEAARFHGNARRLEWAGSELRVFHGDTEPIRRPETFRGVTLSYWRAG